MSITVYSNTDSGAPSISRNAGVMITWADAVLVSGYGTQSSCGWTKSLSGTNLAVYTAPSSLGNLKLFMDDTNSNYTKILFAEGITDITTPRGVSMPVWEYGPGSGSTATQWSLWYKTQTALSTGTNIRWRLVNNTNYGFYLWTDYNNETASAKPTSARVTFIVKPSLVGLSNPGTSPILVQFPKSITIQDLTGFSSGINFASELYIDRFIYSPRGNPRETCKWSPVGNSQFTYNDVLGAATTNYGTYPDPIAGNLMVNRIWAIADLYDKYALPIGYWPGVLAPLHNVPLDHLTTVTGSTPYATSTFEVWCGGNGGSILIDTTDNWN